MSGRAFDTTEQAADRFRQLLMQRSAEERLRMASDMFDTARALIVAGLPRDVAANPSERRIAVFLRMYGRDLEPGFLARIVGELRSLKTE